MAILVVLKLSCLQDPSWATVFAAHGAAPSVFSLPQPSGLSCAFHESQIVAIASPLCVSRWFVGPGVTKAF